MERTVFSLFVIGRVIVRECVSVSVCVDRERERESLLHILFYRVIERVIHYKIIIIFTKSERERARES